MIKNQLTVDGIIVAGHQVASGRGATTPYPDSALKLQSPHFLAGGLDISPYFQGTLNISLAQHDVLRVDGEYRFELVEWTPLHPPETFSFSRCHLEYKGQLYDGLVYYPHPETKEAHFQDASILELLSPFIPDIAYGAHITVIVNTNEVILAAS
ncbi:MAG: hypothetical protein AAF614_19725 [Chloroflexota bacterium]